MLSGTFGVSTSNSHIVGQVYWQESSYDINSNTSQVYVEMKLWRNNTGYTSSGTDDFYITVDGQTVSHTGFHYSIGYATGANDPTGSQEILVSGTVTVGHNSDGTKTISIGWSGGGHSTGVFTVTGGSDSATLTNIPRSSTCASTVSWTAGTQDLSINLNVASSSFHHTIEIFVDNPSGVYGNAVATRTSIGSSTVITFSQTELTAIYTQIQGYEWRDAIVRVWTYDSNGTQIGSYQDKYGYCYAIPTATATIGTGNSFNISDLPTLTYSLNNYTTGSTGGFTYNLIFTLGSFTKTFTGLTAQTGTIGFTSADVTAMYNATPNSNTLTGIVECNTYYNGVSTEDGNPATDQTSITAKVTGSNPTFTSAGVTYLDTNSTMTGITGNNQYIIQNNSTLRVAIPVASKASAINGATMVSYSATVNGVTKTGTWSSSADVNIDFGVINASSNVTLTINAIDSRGNSTPQTKTVNIVPYAQPVMVAKAQRLNNFEATTTLSLSGSISRLTIGTDKNTVINQIADPTAQPTLTLNTATSTLPANTYYVKYTWYNSVGETLSGSYSIPSKVVSTSNTNTITVTVPTKPTGATGAKIYVGTSSSAFHYQGSTTGTTYTLSSYNSSGASYPSTNTTSQMQYRYKDSSLSTYSAWDSFTFTLTNGAYTATSETLTLDNTKSWDIQVQVIDKITTAPTPVQLSVGVGQPIMFIDTTKKSIGINQFPSNNNSLELTGSMYVNGTLGTSTSQTLNQGSNTVNGALVSPISFKGINGKTLMNVLSPWGNCEVASTHYHGVQNATLSVDQTNYTMGGQALKVTATTATGEHYAVLGVGDTAIYSRNFKVNPSSYYVLVGAVRPNNGQGALRLIRWSTSGSLIADTIYGTKATDTSKFVNQYFLVATSSTDSSFEIRLNLYDSSGNGSFTGVSQSSTFDAIRCYELSSTEYNSLSGQTADQLASKYPYVDGIAPIVNPTVQMGSTYMTVQTTLYNAFGVQDSLFIDTDGKLKKHTYIKEITFDGGTFDVQYQGGYGSNGWKYWSVGINTGLPDYSPNIRLQRHNGEYIIPLLSGSWSSYDPRFVFNSATNKRIEFGANFADSGWGDAYTPTNDEVRAYLNGYKMYMSGDDGTGFYYGSGTKAWCFQRYDGTYTHYTTNIDDCLRVPAWRYGDSSGYTSTMRFPWKLIYKLPTPIIEEVEVTGEIMIQSGANTVTATQGVVRGESFNPVTDSASYYFNCVSYNERAKYPVVQVLQIYKNGIPDPNWTFATSRYYNELFGDAYIPVNLFDPTAVYTADYLIKSEKTVPLDTIDIYVINSVTDLLNSNTQQLFEHDNDITQLFALTNDSAKVVAQGSNLNGSYVRYSNGLQFCWFNNYTPSTAGWWATGQPMPNISEYYMYIAKTWTFPIAFKGVPACFASGDFGGAMPEHHQIYTTSTGNGANAEHGVVWSGGVDNGTNGTYNQPALTRQYFAIGFWK